ncbi:unnamed protein product [Microthlaspi erraticum]|uniref:Transposase MuDR plant domain-containing protein n=1 Tax=Microthlaspi erraticum TaxID=1685480 RepID=A0A6D2KXH6_9BRAS|nr:unnamed protein product [Microthlaspi erraticum]
MRNVVRKSESGFVFLRHQVAGEFLSRFVDSMAEMVELEVFCYWNGCIKYGRDGVYYEGSSPKVIKVKRKTELRRLLDELYRMIGLDTYNQRSKVKIFGRYPCVVGKSLVKYLLLPVVNDESLETMLEVPSNHPCIQNVELYLEVKSAAAACPSLLSNSSKRQRIDEVGHVGDSSVSHKDSSSGVPKPCVSGLWLDEHDLRVGLCFKDGGELKKAVNWCSIKGQRKCVTRETGKEDEYMFECIRWKCKWSLCAARI